MDLPCWSVGVKKGFDSHQLNFESWTRNMSGTNKQAVSNGGKTKQTIGHAKREGKSDFCIEYVLQMCSYLNWERK